MAAQDIKALLDTYNRSIMQRTWIKNKNLIEYENEYLSVLRVDSSNNWISDHDMVKMWSIIFDLRKNFTSLSTYQSLQNVLDIKITPVTRGQLTGNWGIRIYGMKVDPDSKIIKTILDFIFS